MSNKLIIGVPSKGRLQDNTHAFFARAGLKPVMEVSHLPRMNPGVIGMKFSTFASSLYKYLFISPLTFEYPSESNSFIWESRLPKPLKDVPTANPFLLLQSSLTYHLS